MLKVTFDKVTAASGEVLPLRVFHSDIRNYEQVQMEIYNVAVLNPMPRLSFGVPINFVAENTIEAGIDTKFLTPGDYEIFLIRFHTPKIPGIPQELDFVPSQHVGRLVMRILVPDEQPQSAFQLLSGIQVREGVIENRFLEVVDVRGNPEVSGNEYCVFIFVRDLLVGTRIRFPNFEIIPTQSGLDGNDAFAFINRFLRNHTTTGIEFNYGKDIQTSSRQQNPVCVIHFPTILASTPEEACNYCIEKTNRLLLALSLSRSAGGVIFDVVLYDRIQKQGMNFSITNSYRGNLLTGHLSGENPDGLSAYLDGLERNTLNSFLVGLYKEAVQERNTDFQYVRYWQILEALADGCNYDPTKPLLDFEGNEMMDGDKVRRIKGAGNIVFNLLRENNLGTTESTWKKVNTWLAFRNAVAHFGAVSRFSELRNDKDKMFAGLGYAEILRLNHDHFLWELKEDTKMILMRTLTKS